MRHRYTSLAAALLVCAALLPACKKKNVKDQTPTEEALARADFKAPQENSGQEVAEGDLRDAILALRRVHFGFDSAELTDDSRNALKEAASKLADKNLVHLYVEGHADQAGETEYNMTLGEKRAKAVSGYLEKLGVGGDRLHIVSYGEEVPLKEGGTKAALAANRRVDFKLMRGDLELVLEESAVID